MSDAPPTGTPPPGEPPAADRPPKVEEEKTVGELVFEVSEQASVLIREEIELAKTEVSEKVNRLLAGSVAGLVAG
ncbi:MAG: phage holin family protein, partial [Solirubrobacterales bacterium]